MLSKFDIQKELGREICVFPLDLNNIKENSINLCTGNFAWSMATREVFFSEKENDKNCTAPKYTDSTKNTPGRKY